MGNYLIIFIEKTIRLLKKDNDYHINKLYSQHEIFFIVISRFIQVIRGFCVKARIKSTSGFTFCGKNVKLHYSFLIRSGKSLILEDNVCLNALSHKGIVFGNNVTVAKNSILQCTGVIANKGIGIVIGNNSAVGANSYLGGQGGIEIGNDVIMGPGVMIFSENHNYDKLNIVIRKQGERRRCVIIRNNCWIGAGVIILAGVEISEGCVIAAGSVVNKSIPNNSIVAGIPAKIIKSRIN